MNNRLLRIYSEAFSGCITDLDGTLCDTMNANLLSYKQAFNDVNIDFDDNVYKENFGLRFDLMIKQLAPTISDDKIGIIIKNKTVHYKNNLHLIKPNSELISLLHYLKRNGAKIGLATTASRQNALEILKYLSLIELFDVTVFGEDVNNGKPDPECYNLVIDKMHIDSNKCLIFEDSDIGEIAAKKSGAHVLRVKI